MKTVNNSDNSILVLMKRGGHQCLSAFLKMLE